VTEPHLFAMFCPFCRDVLAQRLKGKYEILIKRGHKVMSYEGNMGDEREFDEAAVINRISIFLESLGLKKPA
jgi:hypothetical protein